MGTEVWGNISKEDLQDAAKRIREAAEAVDKRKKEPINIAVLMCEAMINFLNIFGLENVGTFEIEYWKVLQYVNSPEFRVTAGWDMKSIDDCYQFIEDEVLAGWPIWNFLRLDARAKSVFDDLFDREAQEREDAMKRKYKCMRCTKLVRRRVSLGTLYACLYKRGQAKEEGHRASRHRGRAASDFDPFINRGNCKGYTEEGSSDG